MEKDLWRGMPEENFYVISNSHSSMELFGSFKLFVIYDGSTVLLSYLLLYLP